MPKAPCRSPNRLVARRLPSWRSPVALPEPVYRELIHTLFSMRLPIVAMGIVCAGVAALLATKWSDPVFATVAALAVFVTLFRFLVILSYRSHPEGTIPQQELPRWERRYAIGNYAFATLIAALNVRALTYHDPLMHMITVSIVFGFGAGIVARISVRPTICVISLLLATAPTIAALAWHASLPNPASLHAQMFAVEAVLVGMIAILSLSTVHHLHRSAVEHLITRYDLTLLAKRDPLTGLANRLLLRERLQDYASALQGDAVALHYLDLDGFKAVNDVHGHPAGDELLREVARRMEKAVRAGNTVARLGGDEFVVLQADLGHADEAEMLARRLIRSLSAPYRIGEQTIVISASIGIATAIDFGFDLERLLACADCALYRSKSRGKKQFNFATQADLGKLAKAAA
jgi:diguanylate cyclase (GGDEF)-like protein